jgi:hypothetical protein
MVVMKYRKSGRAVCVLTRMSVANSLTHTQIQQQHDWAGTTQTLRGSACLCCARVAITQAARSLPVHPGGVGLGRWMRSREH